MHEFGISNKIYWRLVEKIEVNGHHEKEKAFSHAAKQDQRPQVFLHPEISNEPDYVREDFEVMNCHVFLRQEIRQLREIIESLSAGPAGKMPFEDKFLFSGTVHDTCRITHGLRKGKKISI